MVNEELLALLNLLPHKDLNEYKRWMAVTTMVKSMKEGNPVGNKLGWDVLSKKSTRYDEVDNETTWENVTDQWENNIAELKSRFANDSVAFETLCRRYTLAFQAGLKSKNINQVSGVANCSTSQAIVERSKGLIN